MNISLRKYTPADFPVTTGWRNASRDAFPPQPEWTIDSQYYWYYMTYVPCAEQHVYIAEADGHAAAMIGVNSRTREIGQVLTDPARRGTGVMTAALPLLYQAFGPGQYWLRVLAANQRAIAFYRRNGYRGITRPPAGPPGGPDYLVMGKAVREGEL